MLKAGVAGAGVFGGYHARKYVELDGVELTAVYDQDLTHAARLAEPLGALPFDDYPAFLAAIEAVTIATPADSHSDLAAEALAAGRHAYVEKPLAVTATAARNLVQAAGDKGLVLACGHQERVIFAAMGLLDLPGAPRSLKSVRRGLPSPRNRDVSCVLDLMIHDLDLAVRLAGSAVAGVHAEGGFDEVRAEITFAGGLIAHFEASRVAEARERTMNIVFVDGQVEVDFLAPSFLNTTAFALNSAFADTPDGRDPLGASVRRFVEAVQGLRPRPAVTGAEGAAALDLALAVEAAAKL